jgi:hypothetical protein
LEKMQTRQQVCNRVLKEARDTIQFALDFNKNVSFAWTGFYIIHKQSSIYLGHRSWDEPKWIFLCSYSNWKEANKVKELLTDFLQFQITSKDVNTPSLGYCSTALKGLSLDSMLGTPNISNE